MADAADGKQRLYANRHLACQSRVDRGRRPLGHQTSGRRRWRVFFARPVDQRWYTFRAERESLLSDDRLEQPKLYWKLRPQARSSVALDGSAYRLSEVRGG